MMQSCMKCRLLEGWNGRLVEPTQAFFYSLKLATLRGGGLRFLWWDQPRSSQRHLLAEEFSPAVICASRGEQFSLQTMSMNILWCCFPSPPARSRLAPANRTHSSTPAQTGMSEFLKRLGGCVDTRGPDINKNKIQFGLFSQLMGVNHDAGKSDLIWIKMGKHL